MKTPQTAEVANGVYLIDTEMYGVPSLNAVYLVKGEQLALVDAGPSTTASNVLKGIRHLGLKPSDISYVVLSHVHLDHGGAAGHLLKEMPAARTVVWHKAARHVADPSRLMAATREAQGERGLQRYGEALPIDESRVIPVEDDYVLDLGGGETLRVLYSPGHSRHEITIYEKRNGGLFTGDGTGWFMKEGELMPTAIAPDFDQDVYLATVSRVMELPLKMLFFPHFGASAKPRETLQLNFQELEVWAKVVEREAGRGDWEAASGKLRDYLNKKAEVVKSNSGLYQYMLEDQVPMFLEGYIGYRKGKAQAPKG